MDPHDAGKDVRDVLPGFERIGRTRAAAVPRRDVETPVRSEFEAPAVVPSLQPADDQLFAVDVAARRIGAADGEPRDTRSLRILAAAGIAVTDNIADVAETVLGELRMEREAVDRFDGQPLFGALGNPLNERVSVEKRIGCRGSGVIRDREELAELFGDKEPVSPRSTCQDGRILEMDLRKDALGPVQKR